MLRPRHPLVKSALGRRVRCIFQSFGESKHGREEQNQWNDPDYPHGRSWSRTSRCEVDTAFIANVTAVTIHQRHCLGILTLPSFGFPTTIIGDKQLATASPFAGVCALRCHSHFSLMHAISMTIIRYQPSDRPPGRRLLTQSPLLSPLRDADLRLTSQ